MIINQKVFIAKTEKILPILPKKVYFLFWLSSYLAFVLRVMNLKSTVCFELSNRFEHMTYIYF